MKVRIKKTIIGDISDLTDRELEMIRDSLHVVFTSTAG